MLGFFTAHILFEPEACAGEMLKLAILFPSNSYPLVSARIGSCLESCTVMVVIVLVPLSLVCVSAGFLLTRQKSPFLKFLSARFTSPRFMQWVIILCICRIYFDAQLFLIWPVEDNWKEEPTRFFFPLPLSLLRTVPVHRQPWQLG